MPITKIFFCWPFRWPGTGYFLARREIIFLVRRAFEPDCSGCYAEKPDLLLAPLHLKMPSDCSIFERLLRIMAMSAGRNCFLLKRHQNSRICIAMSAGPVASVHALVSFRDQARSTRPPEGPDPPRRNCQREEESSTTEGTNRQGKLERRFLTTDNTDSTDQKIQFNA